MELEYESLKNELLRLLDSNKTWVLATSDGVRVSARAMSVVHDDLTLYFQTNRHFEKCNQMAKNQNVALCCANASVEGIAYEVGTWEDNPAVKEVYIEHHKGSYELYGTLPGQVVIKVVPHYAVFWKYIGGEPARDFLHIPEERAERLFYFEQYSK